MLKNQDLFKSNADILVIPRSTAGTFSKSFESYLDKVGLKGLGEKQSPLGSIEYYKDSDIKETELKKNKAPFLFKGIVFATSVEEFSSQYAIIRRIGHQLGDLTKGQPSIKTIATPLLSTGAGGLAPDIVYKILETAFKETATGDSVLQICILQSSEYKELSGIDIQERNSAKVALEALIPLLKEEFWCKGIAENDDFYFNLAARKLNQFKKFTPSSAATDQFYLKLKEVAAEKKSIQELINLYSKESDEYKFILLTGQLFAYIDYNAYNKNLWNEYRDKRILSESTLSQNEWLENLLDYKITGEERILSPIISNAFKYLEDPDERLTMLDEEHRSIMMKNIFNIEYRGSLEEVFWFFRPRLECQNEQNIGHLYTTFLYSSPVRKIWLEEEAGKPLTLNQKTPNKTEFTSSYKEAPRTTSPLTSSIQNRNVILGLLSDKTKEDLLDYKVYSHAIVKFIKDPSTKAPVTIGIFAPWGRGKTTLMEYIQTDLETYQEEKKVDPAKKEEAIKENNLLSYGKLLDWLKDFKSAPPGLNKLKNPVVWFNAWKFQKSEQIWSGFAYEIIRQLVSKLTPPQQEQFWLYLNLKRIDRRKLTDHLTFSILNTALRHYWLLPLSVIIIILGAFIYSPLRHIPQANLWGFSSGIVSLSAALKAVYDKARKKKVNFDLEKYVAAPNYKEQMGYFHSVEDDLKKVLELLVSEDDAAVIIVDDLDRCSPKIVADVIEAINLFISGDFPECYFILGQDAQMVTASLDAAYKDIEGKTIYVQKSYGSLGWYFMEKFIQLPFTIPTISADQSANLLHCWMGIADRLDEKKDEILSKRYWELMEKLDQTRNNYPSLLKLLPEIHEISPQLSLLAPDKAISLRKNILDCVTLGLSQDTNEIRSIIELYGKYLGNSPRTIKRFANLYHFHRLLQYTGKNSDLYMIDTQVIARWVVVMIRWPQLVRCIQWDSSEAFFTGSSPKERVAEFEKTFIGVDDFAVWKASFSPEIEYSSWLTDIHLFEFMTKTKSENGKLENAISYGFW